MSVEELSDDVETAFLDALDNFREALKTIPPKMRARVVSSLLDDVMDAKGEDEIKLHW